ncbi:hypothetical protein [Ruania zhangjianzhongii]|uniref:hypothetical protein n=1 Tax=Ruania zhangjianzhongii TaxID=2603206 RepID=UPI0011CA3606|nr:hypothetical protein [Ruania zhangjianzhongii]
MASTSSHPHLPGASSGGRQAALRWIRAVPAIALLLSLAASVALLLLPFYGNRGEPTGTATLIEVNGSGVVILLAVPVLLTATIALAKDRPWISMLCTLALAGFTVLTVASIGMFYLPALVVASVGVIGRSVVSGSRSRVGRGPHRRV